jgi:O-antigen/teichoic acid export membrane protein
MVRGPSLMRSARSPLALEDSVDTRLTKSPRPGRRRGPTLAAVSAIWVVSLAVTQGYSLILLAALPAIQAGIVNFATATAAILIYMLDFGLNTSMVVAARDRRARLEILIRVTLLFRVVGLLVASAALGAGIVSHAVPNEYVSVFALIWLGFVIRLTQTPFYALLQAQDQQTRVALIILAQAAGRLGSLALLAALHWFSLEPIAAAGVIVDLLTVAAFWAAAGRTRVPDPPDDHSVDSEARKLLRAAPMLTAAGAVQILQSRVDWVLVALMTSYSALANYAVANKGVEVFVLLGANFGRTALPWLVGGWSGARINRSVQILIAVSGLGGATMVVAGSELVRVTFGSKYPLAQSVIPILGVLAPALVLSQVIQFGLFARGDAGWVVVAGTMALFGQIGVDIATIPSSGIRGAAFGMAAFAAVQVVMLTIVGIRRNVLSAEWALLLFTEVAVLPVLLVADRLGCAYGSLPVCW